MNRFYKLSFWAIVLFTGCGNQNHNPFHLVSKYSGIRFDESNLKLIHFEDPGFKENLKEGINFATFEMKNINFDSLAVELSNLNYKRLPIPNLPLAGEFAGNVSLSDKGYYKQNLKKTGFEIEKMIIINFTRKKVIYYELW
jgi:hypothetical protein